ncbi:MAG: 4Fe-4S binding protein [Lentisphaerae bacterium]|nr:4Fe-4S binding protein [Lentisphaerota bacterium]
MKARLQQGYHTLAYPAVAPSLPDRLRGLPVLAGEPCPADCKRCVEVCPSAALSQEQGRLVCDLGRCIFCGACARVCPAGRIAFSNDHRLATRSLPDLHFAGGPHKLAAALESRLLSLFGRSLKLRQVSAGGCNACEADVNVLTTLAFDLSRFGIKFVASPRHADGLLITGPVSHNMRLALLKTYAAVPPPKLVIAVGACAISGGLYREHAETCQGAASLVPVDLFIPGCPPHPLTILDGLLRLLDRLPQRVAAARAAPCVPPGPGPA